MLCDIARRLTHGRDVVSHGMSAYCPVHHSCPLLMQVASVLGLIIEGTLAGGLLVGRRHWAAMFSTDVGVQEAASTIMWFVAASLIGMLFENHFCKPSFCKANSCLSPSPDGNKRSHISLAQEPGNHSCIVGCTRHSVHNRIPAYIQHPTS